MLQQGFPNEIHKGRTLLRAPPAFLLTVGLAALPRHEPKIESGGVITDMSASNCDPPPMKWFSVGFGGMFA